MAETVSKEVKEATTNKGVDKATATKVTKPAEPTAPKATKASDKPAAKQEAPKTKPETKPAESKQAPKKEKQVKETNATSYVIKSPIPLYRTPTESSLIGLWNGVLHIQSKELVNSEFLHVKFRLPGIGAYSYGYVRKDDISHNQEA